LIDYLDKITSGFISQARSEDVARAEIETVNDIASLETIQNAAGSAKLVISIAASVRQRRIEAATLAAGSTGFYTAPTSASPVHTGDTTENDIESARRVSKSPSIQQEEMLQSKQRGDLDNRGSIL
jgi:heme/copper-type cytochrome/quinol oxidase subunit 1